MKIGKITVTKAWLLTQGPLVVLAAVLLIIAMILSGCSEQWDSLTGGDRPDNLTGTSSFTWQSRDPGQANCNEGCWVTFQSSTPGASSWSWDFGDGGSSSLKDPAHRYLDEGTWIARLESCPDGRSPGDTDCDVAEDIVETP